MKALVNDLMGRVRDLSMNLRPAMLDDLGLVPALLWQLERYQAQTGIRVEFSHSGLDGRFSPEIETACFRIVQEALTNVARHARISEAKVEIRADGDHLRLQIDDRGAGFDPELALAGRSSGLTGMRERARLLGGRLRIESARGNGTQLLADLPLSASERERVE
jgi:signal transduction histidine kinase